MYFLMKKLQTSEKLFKIPPTLTSTPAPILFKHHRLLDIDSEIRLSTPTPYTLDFIIGSS